MNNIEMGKFLGGRREKEICFKLLLDISACRNRKFLFTGHSEYTRLTCAFRCFDNTVFAAHGLFPQSRI